MSELDSGGSTSNLTSFETTNNQQQEQEQTHTGMDPKSKVVAILMM
jgi:hypothetical protein